MPGQMSSIVLLLYSTVTSYAASVEDISTSVSSDITALPVVLVSVSVLIIVCVAVLLMCTTGCYNAEVDTSSHPACRSSGSKSGGAYYPTNTTSDVNTGVMQSSWQSNDYVSPSSNSAPLPYTMIPTHIPEDAGFSGYQTGPNTPAGYGANSGGGLAGYGGPQVPAGYGGSQATAPIRTGAHVNPMEREQPPPSYGEALQGFG